MYQYWNDKEIDNIKFVSRNVFIFWYTELIAKIINQISNQIQANKKSNDDKRLCYKRII